MLMSLKKICPVLFEDRMPVWLTLVLSLSAAVATYYLSPSINRHFQIDEARATHVAKATDLLNSEIIQLSGKVRRLNSAFLNDPNIAASIREDCLDLVTQMQWQLVDLKVVLATEGGVAAVDKLAKSLTAVKKELDTATGAGSQTALLHAMAELGASAQDVLDKLYIAASLK
jgi:hypothetical protein